MKSALLVVVGGALVFAGFLLGRSLPPAALASVPTASGAPGRYELHQGTFPELDLAQNKSYERQELLLLDTVTGDVFMYLNAGGPDGTSVEKWISTGPRE